MDLDDDELKATRNLNRMSEEEIINKITEMINELRDDINRVEDWVNTGEDEEKLETLEGILDLYNKEKEKNKELTEGLKYRVNYCKLLEKELYGNGINYNMELTKIEEKYLKELLEEVE